MPSITEGKLCFDFAIGWKITQYDQWAFYRRRFNGCCLGNKAVDLIAHGPDSDVLWLIEVKDYRRDRRQKPDFIWDEVAVKVRDTLAGLVAAKSNAANPEQLFATNSLRKPRLKFVLHLEQPTKTFSLFRRDFDPASLQQKIRQLIKPIDAHARVTEINAMSGIPWTVTSVP